MRVEYQPTTTKTKKAAATPISELSLSGVWVEVASDMASW
jgi:hypothetical protein